MTNYERFVKTINFELPDRILTYDFADNRELLEKYGGRGNLLERNGCNDIFAIREKYPNILLFGNVCCAVTLPYGT